MMSDNQMRMDMEHTEVTCNCGRVHMREWYLVDASKTTPNKIAHYTRCNQCQNISYLHLDLEDPDSFPVGSGWRDMVIDLHQRLTDKYPDYKIEQVKEKFGGLRYYVSGVDREGQEMIDEVEAKSYRTCEECGDPGKSQGSGWVRTLCDDCASKPL